MTARYVDRARRALRRALAAAAPELAAGLRWRRSGPFIAKRIDVELPPGPVLVLAPHPDDEAIGVGGTIGLHLDRGSEVTVLYMTDGRGLSDVNLSEVRRKEAESVGRIYGIRQAFWNVPDTQLRSDPDRISDLADVLRMVGPRTVYLPSFFEHHRDHLATNPLLIGALERAHVGPTLVAGYEVWDNLPFPNHVVDITGQFRRKQEMLSHYATALAATDFQKLCSSRNALHYLLHVDTARGREGYAEVFCLMDWQSYAGMYQAYVAALRGHGTPAPEEG